MPQFLLNVVQPDGPPPAVEVLAGITRDVDEVTRAMRAAGVWVMGAGLAPAEAAVVVRATSAGASTTDGPFAETREHIGGFTLVKVAGRDEAVAWAARLAQATTLPIEVRELRSGG